MGTEKVETMNDELLAVKALERLLETVDSIGEAGSEAMTALMALGTPFNMEIMKLAMLLQASYSFSVALQQWLEVAHARQEELKKEMNKSTGN